MPRSVNAQDCGLAGTVTSVQLLENQSGFVSSGSYQQHREAEVAPRPCLCLPFPSLSSNYSIEGPLVGMVWCLRVGVLSGGFHVLFGEMSI